MLSCMTLIAALIADLTLDVPSFSHADCAALIVPTLLWMAATWDEHCCPVGVSDVNHPGPSSRSTACGCLL